MVRRTREDAVATREQLLDAAERVFRDQGVTRTSLAEVAAEAGVTRGAVYWHFRDKADLFAAMCERATSPMDTLVEQAHGSGSGLAARHAARAVRRLADPSHGRRARSGGVRDHVPPSELAGELSGVAERHDRDCCHARACVETVIARAVAPASCRAIPTPTLAMRALHAYVTGLMHEWTLDPDAYDLRTSAPALVDTFIAGLVRASRAGRRLRRRRRRRAAFPRPGASRVASDPRRRGTRSGFVARHNRGLALERSRAMHTVEDGRRHRRRHDGQRHRAGLRGRGRGRGDGRRVRRRARPGSRDDRRQPRAAGEEGQAHRGRPRRGARARAHARPATTSSAPSTWSSRPPPRIPASSSTS